jgi:hypothetical protein
MIDEKELEDSCTCADHLRIARADYHPVGRDHRTRRLELRHFFDLDHADAARTVNGDAGVVAVIRDRDAGLDACLQNRFPFFYRDLPSVYRQRDGFHNFRIISQENRASA